MAGPADAARGRFAAAAAARATGVSERALRRRFAEAVGYGPAMLARVLRLQRFLQLAHATPGTSLGRLAVDAGYADHAHLVHDCRGLAGATPGELVARGARPAGDPSLRLTV